MISAPAIDTRRAGQAASSKSLTKDTACHVSLAHLDDQGNRCLVDILLTLAGHMAKKSGESMEKYVYCKNSNMIGKKRGIEVSPWEVEIDEAEYAYIERMRIQMYHNQKIGGKER